MPSVAGFADAEYYDPAWTAQHQPAGPDEAVIDPRGELRYSFRFNRQNLASERFKFVVVDKHSRVRLYQLCPLAADFKRLQRRRLEMRGQVRRRGKPIQRA